MIWNNITRIKEDKMEVIKIDVKQKIASVEGTPIIVCGNSDYTMSFTFDDEWNDEKNKVARFRFKKFGLKKFIDMPIHDDTCRVPKLVGIGLVRVGVYAGNLKTTTGAKIECQKSILCDDAEEMAEPFENLYDELHSELDNKLGADDVIAEFNKNATFEDNDVYSANAVNKEFNRQGAYIDKKLAEIDAKEDVGNKVTEVDEDSTDDKYASAKAVYDFGTRILAIHQEQVDAQMNELEERLTAYIGGLDNGYY
jgi:hypothetical protein